MNELMNPETERELWVKRFEKQAELTLDNNQRQILGEIIKDAQGMQTRFWLGAAIDRVKKLQGELS
jgi:hypothetical protein